MLQRIGLFLMTNVAIIAVLSIFIYIAGLFGFNISSTGSYGSILALSAIIGFTGSFLSLAISRWIAKKSYKITPITIDQVSDLSEKERVVWNTVSDLAERNNIKMPEVGIYNDQEPNAFATGPSKNKSLVAVSTGLLDIMDKGAIEGVVAHEMAHILNGDMVTMTLLQGIVNTFVIFAAKIVANIVSNFVDEQYAGIARFAVDFILQIVFCILASVITMNFSRYREFKADAGAAEYV
jgi:heat shock protein HtpX